VSVSRDEAAQRGSFAPARLGGHSRFDSCQASPLSLLVSSRDALATLVVGLLAAGGVTSFSQRQSPPISCQESHHTISSATGLQMGLLLGPRVVSANPTSFFGRCSSSRARGVASSLSCPVVLLDAWEYPFHGSTCRAARHRRSEPLARIGTAGCDRHIDVAIAEVDQADCSHGTHTEATDQERRLVFRISPNLDLTPR